MKQNIKIVKTQTEKSSLSHIFFASSKWQHDLVSIIKCKTIADGNLCSFYSLGLVSTHLATSFDQLD